MRFFQKEIKSMRKRFSLSQQELADKLSVSQRIVSYWERGQKEPKDIHQAKLDALFLKLKKKRLYIFDLPPLLKKEGKEDFLTMLLNLMREENPEYIAAACEEQGFPKYERYSFAIIFLSNFFFVTLFKASSPHFLTGTP